ncbi:MAG: hypothetical protein IT243_03775 [Bacteroidia bacterium]|nr:hypothetical protein [Bacteroidia bacterium]
MELNPEKTSIFGFDFEDLVVKDYDPHPRIKFSIAI